MPTALTSPIPQSAPTAPAARGAGSHRFEIDGDRATVFDLELFSGFDPEFDPKDSRFKRFDRKEMERIVEKTRRLMDKGQNPKVFAGHNPDDPDDLGREAIGDIPQISLRDVDGIPTIFADRVEMATTDFECFLKSNRYPRRSAEIAPSQGLLDGIALLGSLAPARPIPDTKFSHDGESESFVRDGVEYFARFNKYATGGPGNVSPPGATDMPEDKDDMKATTDEDDDTKAKATTEEDDDDTAKAEDDEDKDDSKAKSKASRTRKGRESEVVKAMREEMATLKADLHREKFGRQLDADKASGLHVTDKQQEMILERVCASAKPEVEYEALTGLCQRDPIGLKFDQSGAEIPETDKAKFAKNAKVEERAREIQTMGTAGTSKWSECMKAAREEVA